MAATICLGLTCTPAQIEFEYKGEDAIAEVRRCYEYCRKALES